MATEDHSPGRDITIGIDVIETPSPFFHPRDIAQRNRRKAVALQVL